MMRNLNELNQYRVCTEEILIYYGSYGDETCGVFKINSPMDTKDLLIVVSSFDRWEHVSVSKSNRIPSWGEMSFVMRKFFKPDETVMQLHVPESEHINCHPNCLHLWRPIDVAIPKPPSYMVA